MSREKVIPPLGFPGEMWDEDNDYFCEPVPGYVACILMFDTDRLNVDICAIDAFFKDKPISRAWQYGGGKTYVDVFADCPLQAQAIIQNFINDFPPANKGDSYGEHCDEQTDPRPA